jgi:hypothetical protein
MSDSQVSIGAALGYAWTLWRSHWREIWGVLALNALAYTVWFAGSFAGDSNIAAAGWGGLLVTTFPVYGSIMRLAFGAEHPRDADFQLGALGMQWRRMEARLLMANLLLTLLLFLVLVICAGLAAVVLLGVFAAKASGHLPAAGAMTQAYVDKTLGPDAFPITMAFIVAVLIFVMMRLALYIPATAESQKVQVIKTWRLTRGRFWQIFGATLVLWLPSLVITIFGNGAALAANGGPAPLAPGETFFYSLICGCWAGAAAMPLMAGVQAYFYRNVKTAD